LILISGFRQNKGIPNGFTRLWREARGHSSARSVVEFHTWDTDVKDLAEFIWGQSGSDPDIVIAGYSWGGSTSVNLARALKKRGLRVRHMILADPVYRNWWRLWASMFRGGLLSIQIPNSVSEVSWFRQRENRPQGHNLVAESPITIINDPVIKEVEHAYMDDQDDFHQLVLAASLERK
jgi:pimeloyl-ACP methyl ester carboxylesterase